MRRSMTMFLGFLVPVLALAINALGQVGGAHEQKSIAIVFNDGHRQSIPLSEIARIDLKSGQIVAFKDGRQQNLSLADVTRIEFSSKMNDSPLGRNHFVGKWKVGIDVGAGHFFITLEPNGEARKSMGASHGTWTVVDGEARVTWDDGWHDAIRKVGAKHEKFAYAPGKTFSDEPSNVTSAENTTAEPI